MNIVEYSKPKNQKIIIFDRDNTLIQDNGYTWKLQDLKLLPDTLKTLKYAVNHGFDLAIASNQSGVGRGFYRLHDLNKFNSFLNSKVMEYTDGFVAIASCTHVPEDNCECRKPKPGLLTELIQRYEYIKEESCFIGDSESDFLAGNAAKLATFKVTKNSIFEVTKKWVDECDFN